MLSSLSSLDETSMAVIPNIMTMIKTMMFKPGIPNFLTQYLNGYTPTMTWIEVQVESHGILH